MAFACQSYVQVPKNSTDTAQRGHRPGEAASSGGRQAAAVSSVHLWMPEYTGDDPGAALSLRHRGPCSGPRGGLLHLPISHSRCSQSPDPLSLGHALVTVGPGIPSPNLLP